MRMNEAKSGVHIKFLAIALVLLMAFTFVGCNKGTDTSKQAEEETEQEETQEDAQEEAEFFIEGAYHPQTGAFEPTELFPDPDNINPAELNTATQNLIESEESGDERNVFIMVSLSGDDVIDFGNVRGSASLGVKGDGVGYASMCRDSCPLNYDENDGYWGDLYSLGYLDTETAYTDCARGETCYIVMEFMVDAELLASDAEATLTWGDISVDFNLSAVQEVDTPLDMISDLQN